MLLADDQVIVEQNLQMKCKKWELRIYFNDNKNKFVCDKQTYEGKVVPVHN
jgi:hypothetical protein